MKKALYHLMLAVLFMGCASDKDYIITFHTRYGNMKAILYEETPKHKENFIKLAREGFYDSLLFHRVIEGFMIQSGDPNSRNARKGQRLGQSGPGYTIPAEFKKKLFHVKGSLSAARQNDNINPQKASSGSQFYIVQGKKLSEEELTTDMDQLAAGVRRLIMEDDSLNNELMTLYQSGNFDGYQKRLMELKPRVKEAYGMSASKEYPVERLKAYTGAGGAPHLDDQYTVFGKVVEGLAVIDTIANQRTDRMDRPVEDIRMTVTLEALPKKKITKLYGYQYPED